MNLTGAILAGGRGLRFGPPKATFELQGKPMLMHGLDALSEVCTERLVVARPDTPLPPLPPDVRLLYDEFEIQHPLSGILTALRHASHPWVFICAVDMPFLNPALIRWMMSLISPSALRPSPEYDVVVPEAEGRLQPLHALYRREVYEELASFWAEGEPIPSLQSILRHPTLQVRVLTPGEWRAHDPNGRSFSNLNTPDEPL